MSEPHFTLTPWFNVLLMAVSAVVTGVLLFSVHPRPLLSTSIGVVAGLLAGILQPKSIRSSPALFAAARSAPDVRRALRSNRPGTLSIATIWATGLALFAVALAYRDNALAGFVTGYASFMCIREVVVFGAMGDVRRIAQVE